MLLSDMFSPFYLFGLLTLAKLSNGQAGVCSQTALNTCTAGTGTNCYRLLAGVGIGALPAVEVIPFCNIYTQAAYVGAAALPAAVLAVCGTTTTRISSICSCLVSNQGTVPCPAGTSAASATVTSTTTRATSPITTSTRPSIPISTSIAVDSVMQNLAYSYHRFYQSSIHPYVFMCSADNFDPRRLSHVLYTKFCSVKFSEAKFILETFAPHVQRPTVDKLTDSRIVVKSQDKYSGR
ncbi:hypothetical protein B2J93_9600 [Marssonina coronariae]|uniref:Uncharacterized protein n=1 Tax=Diplocarpon coronariae TaxID=2795749 RepID=A0A218ZFV8_9HELO|nr:hypothetical protein B2J93_9600 [Marssonina coronariae]